MFPPPLPAFLLEHTHGTHKVMTPGDESKAADDAHGEWSIASDPAVSMNRRCVKLPRNPGALRLSPYFNILQYINSAGARRKSDEHLVIGSKPRMN